MTFKKSFPLFYYINIDLLESNIGLLSQHKNTSNIFILYIYYIYRISIVYINYFYINIEYIMETCSIQNELVIL
jgi:hypothetical protein